MTIGKRIRNRRQELDLTQGELAERAGLSRVCICELEGGKHKPKAQPLVKLAKALRVSTDELLNEERRAV